MSEEDEAVDLEDIIDDLDSPLDASYFVDDDYEEFEDDDLDFIFEDF